MLCAGPGRRNYSLFLADDGLLMGYLECEDFAAAQAAMQAEEVDARWQAEMAPFFEPHVSAMFDRIAARPHLGLSGQIRA